MYIYYTHVLDDQTWFSGSFTSNVGLRFLQELAASCGCPECHRRAKGERWCWQAHHHHVGGPLVAIISIMGLSRGMVNDDEDLQPDSIFQHIHRVLGPEGPLGCRFCVATTLLHKQVLSVIITAGRCLDEFWWLIAIYSWVCHHISHQTVRCRRPCWKALQPCGTSSTPGGGIFHRKSRR